MNNTQRLTRKQQKAVARREQIAYHYRRGIQATRELAKLVGCGHNTAYRDLKVIIAQWEKDASKDISERKAVIGTKLALLQRECWDEWSRSKEQTRAKIVKKKRADGTEEETRTVERGLGDPRYLHLIKECLTQEALMYNVVPKDQQDSSAKTLIDGMVTAALLKLTEQHGMNNEDIEREVRAADNGDQKLLDSVVIDATAIQREADKAEGNGQHTSD